MFYLKKSIPILLTVMQCVCVCVLNQAQLRMNHDDVTFMPQRAQHLNRHFGFNFVSLKNGIMRKLYWRDGWRQFRMTTMPNLPKHKPQTILKKKKLFLLQFALT